jgi:hypothetical protein
MQPFLRAPQVNDDGAYSRDRGVCSDVGLWGRTEIEPAGPTSRDGDRAYTPKCLRRQRFVKLVSKQAGGAMQETVVFRLPTLHCS